jgi:hypothetical protein
MFGWLRRKARPQARRCRFVVVAVKVSDWPSAETMRAVFRRLIDLDPDWCELVETWGVLGFFLVDRDGVRRARDGREALQPLLGAGGATGEAEGDLVAAFDRAGALVSAPVGGAVVEASRRAR